MENYQYFINQNMFTKKKRNISCYDMLELYSSDFIRLDVNI